MSDPVNGVPGGQAALDQLVSILDLEELELNLFRGRTPKEDRVRVFGGQVAGQALVAAGRTVDHRRAGQGRGRPAGPLRQVLLAHPR